MSTLESIIERKCCNWAIKEFGIQNIKLTQSRGIPDRLFMLNGQVLFVEFKQYDEDARKYQLYRHHQLKDNGFRVEIIDNFNDFQELITNWINKND